MLVSVTLDDIKDGQRDNCHACPVAIALRRALQVMVAVYLEDFAIYTHKGAKYYKHCRKVKKWIKKFDAKKKVRPFKFRINGKKILKDYQKLC